MVGTGAGDGRQKHLRLEGVLVGKGEQQLDPEGGGMHVGGAFSFQQGWTLCGTDEQAQTQRHRFTGPGHTFKAIPPGRGPRLFLPLSAPSQGLTLASGPELELSKYLLFKCQVQE